MEKEYIVTYREPAVVTEIVAAHSALRAIEMVREGLGERIDFEIDETVQPTRYNARLVGE
jgi:hypothetical protein